MEANYTSGKIVKDTKICEVPFFRELTLCMNIISCNCIQAVQFFQYQLFQDSFISLQSCTHTRIYVCIHTHISSTFFLHTFRVSPFLCSRLVNLMQEEGLLLAISFAIILARGKTLFLKMNVRSILFQSLYVLLLLSVWLKTEFREPPLLIKEQLDKEQG